MTTDQKLPWISYLQKPAAGSCFSVDQGWANTALSIRCLDRNEKVYSCSYSDQDIKAEHLSTFHAEVRKLAEQAGMRPWIYRGISEEGCVEKETAEDVRGGRVVYVNDDGMFSAALDRSDNTVTLQVTTSDKAAFDLLAVEIPKFIGKRVSAGRVFCICPDPDGGMRLLPVGIASVPFEEGNYNEEVVTDFKAVVADLKSPSPSGRVVIFDGEPGTGKTYLVRSLTAEVPDALFIMTPPEMVSQLGSPALIPLLISLKKKSDTALIFVVEDADSCLAPRAADNMNSISAVLNFSDGILGSLLDIRIVATTNVNGADIDSAILRPGRLSKRIDVCKLYGEQANQIYARLTSTDKKPFRTKDMITLAEVYRAARDGGWTPPARNSSGIGFHSDDRFGAAFDQGDY